MVCGIGLLSGGLDSMLSICVLQQQPIEIIAVTFISPFFGPEKAKSAARALGVPLKTIDITAQHLEMVKNPKHGYGSQMNPCIDCHAMMFRFAGELMKKQGAHFLFSGEVLGERPMSQNKNSLKTVARESGFEQYILRPLSAKLLPPTKLELNGMVDRDRLLDIQGRSRKRQMELAKVYGIKSYPGPAGGCRLTEPNFSNRLRDLFDNQRTVSLRDVELLKVGRHFRLNKHTKCIIGRNQRENEKLEAMKENGDIMLTVEGFPGPSCLIPNPEDTGLLNLAASICVRYSDAPQKLSVQVIIERDDVVEKISAAGCSAEVTKQFII